MSLHGTRKGVGLGHYCIGIGISCMLSSAWSLWSIFTGGNQAHISGFFFLFGSSFGHSCLGFVGQLFFSVSGFGFVFSPFSSVSAAALVVLRLGRLYLVLPLRSYFSVCGLCLPFLDDDMTFLQRFLFLFLGYHRIFSSSSSVGAGFSAI